MSKFDAIRTPFPSLVNKKVMIKFLVTSYMASLPFPSYPVDVLVIKDKYDESEYIN